MQSAIFRRSLVALVSRTRVSADRTNAVAVQTFMLSISSRKANAFGARHMSAGAESAVKEPVTVVIEPATPKPESVLV